MRFLGARSDRLGTIVSNLFTTSWWARGFMTPKSIDNAVLQLVERIRPGTTPVYLAVESESFATQLECFPAVAEKVRRDGGNCQLGWQIWQGRLLVEGEFHAVWRSPQDELHDITPKPRHVTRILFLPDTAARYDGRQVDNVRLNLSRNALMDDFILAREALFRICNKGERAYLSEFEPTINERHDMAVLDGLLIMTEYMATAGMSKVSPCPCKRGAAYALCHAEDLATLVKRYAGV